jgi:hypothetical protein
MRASPLILAIGLSVTSAQAFSGAAGPHAGLRPGGHGLHRLGRYGSINLVPDQPAPVEAPSAPALDVPPFAGPMFAPLPPPPDVRPDARPRRSGPKIIYIGKPPKGDGPLVIYGTD